MNYETSAEIEVAIANHFHVTTHVIVPNVSWGMFGYELDLCVLNVRSLYANEVEIKISKSDLKRDAQKRHEHDRNRNLIRQLWFAMPEKMKGCEEFVPERAGIMYVSQKGRVTVFRQPAVNKLARKWSYEDAFKLARLGTLRTWNLKKRNLISTYKPKVI
jgi:hypothetical protein